jgi:hypothetical protein
MARSPHRAPSWERFAAPGNADDLIHNVLQDRQLL